MKVYHYIYYNLHKTSRKRNAAPEIPVLSFISVCQIFNLITGINLFLIVFKPDATYKIHNVFLVGVIVLFAINYYYFEKKENGLKIIADKKLDLGRKSLLIDLYLILSVFLVGFSYYLLQEF